MVKFDFSIQFFVEDFIMDRRFALLYFILACILFACVVVIPLSADAHSLFNQSERLKRQEKARNAELIETARKLEQVLLKNGFDKNVAKEIARLEISMCKEMAILEMYTFRDHSLSQKDKQEILIASVSRLKKLISEYDAICSPIKRICNRQTVGKARLAVQQHALSPHLNGFQPH